MGKIIVLISACNEATTIGFTIRSILDTGIIDEVVVIDDGSKDKTSEVALKQGAKVIRNPSRFGKGNALNIGIESIKENDPAITVFLDGDLGNTASEVTKLVKPILDGETDMCIAGFNTKKGNKGYDVVKKVASKGIAMLTGCKLNWPLSGQRAMKTECLQTVMPIKNGFDIEVAFTIDWMRAGFSVKEITTDMSKNLEKPIKGFLGYGIQILYLFKVLISRSIKPKQLNRN